MLLSSYIPFLLFSSSLCVSFVFSSTSYHSIHVLTPTCFNYRNFVMFPYLLWLASKQCVAFSFQAILACLFFHINFIISVDFSWKSLMLLLLKSYYKQSYNWYIWLSIPSKELEMSFYISLCLLGVFISLVIQGLLKFLLDFCLGIYFTFLLEMRFIIYVLTGYCLYMKYTDF